MNKIDVIFENEEILAINKMPGMLSVADRFDPRAPNLKREVSRLYPDAMILHRLDRETSGVILFAKTSASQRNIQDQFAKQKIRKEYMAIVCGSLEVQSGIIESRIGNDEKRPGLMKIDKRGRAAHTTWTKIESLGRHWLLKVEPKTGRTHQIRVHLSSIGLPIMADSAYGDGRAFFLSSIKKRVNLREDEVERPLLSRTALHAQKISFTGLNGEVVNIEASLPKDMKATLFQMRKYVTASHGPSKDKIDEDKETKEQ